MVLLKPEEVQRRLGLGRTRVYEMIGRHELPVVRLGRSVRIPEDGLRDWIRERTEQPRVLLTSMPVSAASIPADLRKRSQWVCWQWEMREGKRTKVPINPRTGGPASVTDPNTWSPFAIAENAAAVYDGLGLVVTANDSLVGLDLDACRDPGTGAIEPWAEQAVRRFRSYTEVSPAAPDSTSGSRGSGLQVPTARATSRFTRNVVSSV